MQFSLDQRTATLSVGEFSDFALGPRESGGGAQGLWRAQLGQHWHNELRASTEKEQTVGGALRPDVLFEIPIEGRLTRGGWTFLLGGRIDQLVGSTLREIKTVTRPLPAPEDELRADYPEYFLQLATYAVLSRASSLSSQLSALNRSALHAELVFVETSSGLAQTVALTPFDEALVLHQLDSIVEFLNQRLRATERRRALAFHPAFTELRPGQETIQADLAAAFARSPLVLFEAPTGYGKTGCALEFALTQLRSGRCSRLIWLTGKSTGQIQVVHTLQQMAAPAQCNPLGYTATATPDSPTGTSNLTGYSAPASYWQVRNKSEHCVNTTFHCVRDACSYLAGCAERWPQSGLAKFYLDEHQPRDLDTLREAGRQARICPYEITRTALAFNDVWIGDYNYVFAPDNRTLFFEQPGFDAKDTLLVIDEAHNLPARVADAYSHAANVDDAHALRAELDHLLAPPALTLAVDEWTRLLGALRPTDAIDPAIEADIADLLTRLANLVTTHPLDYAALGPHHSETLWQFAAFAEFVADTKLKKLLWSPRAGELNFTCLDAAPMIGKTLRSFGGAIIMSATLQPFANFIEACGLDGGDAVSSLSAPTPWRAGCYDVGVDVRVDTTFRQRGSHYGTTAATVEALHAASGKAVAVFFPSYAYAESVLRALEHDGSVLRASLQPRLPGLAAQAAWVEENLALTDALFLVLGSSFAESIDLLGGRVSHAMVVGPALPEVNAVQKARMDTLAGLGRDGAFKRVYQVPGLQKVNQALGRLVRAPGQHAKVLLHCRRFADPGYASLLARDYQFGREIASNADLREWLALT